MLAVAAVLSGPAAMAAPVPYDTPVYDPASGSYFELVYVTTTKYSYRHNNDITWPEALRVAATMEYKGARGRLAVVKSVATHEFLMRTFQPKLETWIGLRYWCGINKLQYSDGEFLNPGMFAAWDPAWDHSGGFGCSEYKSYNKQQFMPVYYMPVANGFRWAAHTWAKAWYCFFVEFPTGKP